MRNEGSARQNMQIFFLFFFFTYFFHSIFKLFAHDCLSCEVVVTVNNRLNKDLNDT